MTTAQDFVGEFGARGLIHDSTDRTALRARAAQNPMGVYVGFDPTADSLHIGHLLGQISLRRLQLLRLLLLAAQPAWSAIHLVAVKNATY